MKSTVKTVVVKEKGGPLEIIQTELPSLKDNEVLVRMQASTINPSDHLLLTGQFFQASFPIKCGVEGVGRVVEAVGKGQQMKNKRICFTTTNGSWAEYAVFDSQTTLWIEIDDDVPLGSAASGIVNPLTVLGMNETYIRQKKKGIIHTAACSSLGRQLNRLCLKRQIPLLNIVRRAQQVQILKNEGATHVINTSEQNWVQQYKELVDTHGFDCLFDGIGGGQTVNKIIGNSPTSLKIFIYGSLANQPLSIDSYRVIIGNLCGYNLFGWWATLEENKKKEIRANYSKCLKTELQTVTFKQMRLDEINQALQLSKTTGTKGKILVKICDN